MHPRRRSITLQVVSSLFGLVLVASSCSDSSVPSIHEAQLQLWNENNPGDYSFTYEFRAFCGELSGRVTVRDNVVATFAKTTGQRCASVEVPTIDQLFEVARGGPDSAAGISVEYDDDRGFPAEIGLWSDQMTDSARSHRVLDFVAE